MEQAVARENMLGALNRVEQNGGAPGVDGVPTERLRDQIRTEWSRIQFAGSRSRSRAAASECWGSPPRWTA